MGLDWNPLGKPKPGYEDEFASIFQQLGESSDWGWLEKRRRRREGTDREGLHKRWDEIQITPHETVGAPQVGSSAEADAWARERFRNCNPRNHPNLNLNPNSCRRCRVSTCSLSLHRATDFRITRIGRRGTSNGSVSARNSCSTTVKTSLATRLFRSAMRVALRPHSLCWASNSATAPPHTLEISTLSTSSLCAAGDFEEKSPERKLHIIESAARWCEYWSSRGHGLEADW